MDEEIHHRYTLAVIKEFYLRVANGMYGSRDVLARWLKMPDFAILDYPVLFVSTTVLLVDNLLTRTLQPFIQPRLHLGGRIMYDLMVLVFAGSGAQSIRQHWRRLPNGQPAIPYYTVALSATYVSLDCFRHRL